MQPHYNQPPQAKGHPDIKAEVSHQNKPPAVNSPAAGVQAPHRYRDATRVGGTSKVMSSPLRGDYPISYKDAVRTVSQAMSSPRKGDYPTSHKDGVRTVSQATSSPRKGDYPISHRKSSRITSQQTSSPSKGDYYSSHRNVSTKTSTQGTASLPVDAQHGRKLTRYQAMTSLHNLPPTSSSVCLNNTSHPIHQAKHESTITSRNVTSSQRSNYHKGSRTERSASDSPRVPSGHASSSTSSFGRENRRDRQSMQDQGFEPQNSMPQGVSSTPNHVPVTKPLYVSVPSAPVSFASASPLAKVTTSSKGDPLSSPGKKTVFFELYGNMDEKKFGQIVRQMAEVVERHSVDDRYDDERAPMKLQDPPRPKPKRVLSFEPPHDTVSQHDKTGRGSSSKGQVSNASNITISHKPPKGMSGSYEARRKYDVTGIKPLDCETSNLTFNLGSGESEAGRGGDSGDYYKRTDSYSSSLKFSKRNKAITLSPRHDSGTRKSSPRFNPTSHHSSSRHSPNRKSRDLSHDLALDAQGQYSGRSASSVSKETPMADTSRPIDIVQTSKKFHDSGVHYNVNVPPSTNAPPVVNVNRKSDFSDTPREKQRSVITNSFPFIQNKFKSDKAANKVGEALSQKVDENSGKRSEAVECAILQGIHSLHSSGCDEVDGMDLPMECDDDESHIPPRQQTLHMESIHSTAYHQLHGDQFISKSNEFFPNTGPHYPSDSFAQFHPSYSSHFHFRPWDVGGDRDMFPTGNLHQRPHLTPNIYQSATRVQHESRYERPADPFNPSAYGSQSRDQPLRTAPPNSFHSFTRTNCDPGHQTPFQFPSTTTRGSQRGDAVAHEYRTPFKKDARGRIVIQPEQVEDHSADITNIFSSDEEDSPDAMRKFRSGTHCYSEKDLNNNADASSELCNVVPTTADTNVQYVDVRDLSMSSVMSCDNSLDASDFSNSSLPGGDCVPNNKHSGHHRGFYDETDGGDSSKEKCPVEMGPKVVESTFNNTHNSHHPRKDKKTVGQSRGYGSPNHSHDLQSGTSVKNLKKYSNVNTLSVNVGIVKSKSCESVLSDNHERVEWPLVSSQQTGEGGSFHNSYVNLDSSELFTYRTLQKDKTLPHGSPFSGSMMKTKTYENLTTLPPKLLTENRRYIRKPYRENKRAGCIRTKEMRRRKSTERSENRRSWSSSLPRDSSIASSMALAKQKKGSHSLDDLLQDTNYQESYVDSDDEDGFDEVDGLGDGDGKPQCAGLPGNPDKHKQARDEDGDGDGKPQCAGLPGTPDKHTQARDEDIDEDAHVVHCFEDSTVGKPGKAADIVSCFQDSPNTHMDTRGSSDINADNVIHCIEDGDDGEKKKDVVRCLDDKLESKQTGTGRSSDHASQNRKRSSMSFDKYDPVDMTFGLQEYDKLDTIDFKIAQNKSLRKRQDKSNIDPARRQPINSFSSNQHVFGVTNQLECEPRIGSSREYYHGHLKKGKSENSLQSENNLNPSSRSPSSSLGMLTNPTTVRDSSHFNKESFVSDIDSCQVSNRQPDMTVNPLRYPTRDDASMLPGIQRQRSMETGYFPSQAGKINSGAFRVNTYESDGGTKLSGSLNNLEKGSLENVRSATRNLLDEFRTGRASSKHQVELDQRTIPQLHRPWLSSPPRQEENNMHNPVSTSVKAGQNKDSIPSYKPDYFTGTVRKSPTEESSNVTAEGIELMEVAGQISNNKSSIGTSYPENVPSKGHNSLSSAGLSIPVISVTMAPNDEQGTTSQMALMNRSESDRHLRLGSPYKVKPQSTSVIPSVRGGEVRDRRSPKTSPYQAFHGDPVHTTPTRTDTAMDVSQTCTDRSLSRLQESSPHSAMLSRDSSSRYVIKPPEVGSHDDQTSVHPHSVIKSTKRCAITKLDFGQDSTFSNPTSKANPSSQSGQARLELSRILGNINTSLYAVERLPRYNSEKLNVSPVKKSPTKTSINPSSDNIAGFTNKATRLEKGQGQEREKDEIDVRVEVCDVMEETRQLGRRLEAVYQANRNDCECARVEQEVLKTAIDMFGKLCGSQESQPGFSQELRKTNVVIGDALDVAESLRQLCRHGRSVTDVLPGSVILRVKCTTLISLLDLCHLHHTGELHALLFVILGMRKRNLRTGLTLKVTICDRNVRTCLSFLSDKLTQRLEMASPRIRKKVSKNKQKSPSKRVVRSTESLLSSPSSPLSPKSVSERWSSTPVLPTRSPLSSPSYNSASFPAYRRERKFSFGDATRYAFQELNISDTESSSPSTKDEHYLRPEAIMKRLLIPSALTSSRLSSTSSRLSSTSSTPPLTSPRWSKRCDIIHEQENIGNAVYLEINTHYNVD